MGNNDISWPTTVDTGNTDNSLVFGLGLNGVTAGIGSTHHVVVHLPRRITAACLRGVAVMAMFIKASTLTPMYNT